MAFGHGSRSKVYVNGYDLTGYLKSFSSSGQADTHETTTFGKTAKEYIAGLKDATLSAEGLLDGATDAIDQVLAAALGGASSIWNWYLQGDAVVGDDGYGFDAIETSYEIETPVEDVASISVEAQSKVGRERVKSLHPLGQETASGNSTVVDNGAATTNGGVAYLQVPALAGTAPTLDVKIQHSADNVTYTDLIVFTQVTAGRKAERKAVTGTVNRYVKAVWTLAGTGPTATFHVAFGRK